MKISRCSISFLIGARCADKTGEEEGGGGGGKSIERGYEIPDRSKPRS